MAENLELEIKKMADNVQTMTEKAAKVEAVEKELTTVKEELKSAKDTVAVMKDAADKNQVALDELIAARQKGVQLNEDSKTFNDNLAETLKENHSKIRDFKPGADVRLELKAVGDMSYTSNFASSGTYTADNRPAVFPQMQENVWLGDLLPAGRTDGASVTYPRHTGGEGAAAVWEGTGTKPKIDFDFASETSHVKWIAGIVRVPREMLDDLAFLTSFIQSQMLLSLKRAENDFILNGTTGANPVSGLLDVAQTYNGTYTNAVDRLIDAAWGQIVENNHTPTDFVLQPRDAVRIGLNKATGSGEYDLPSNSIAFNNGTLAIGGLRTVPTNLMAANNFLAFDRNGAMFIRRLNPELRMFEQNRDDVETNMITFRVEERATLITPYPKAFVRGLLVPA